MTSTGVHFATPPLTGGAPTARSMILITADGERTMNTYLGACQALSPADIDADVVGRAAITYLEGYLWDPPEAKKAFRRAAEAAHAAGRQVSITLQYIRPVMIGSNSPATTASIVSSRHLRPRATSPC